HFFLDEKVTKKSSRFANQPFSTHILPRHRARKRSVRSKSAGLPARPWAKTWPQLGMWVIRLLEWIPYEGKIYRFGSLQIGGQAALVSLNKEWGWRLDGDRGGEEFRRLLFSNRPA
ncbi:MAG TPA: hypothetical protein PKY12_14610, partial [Catalimonadaceae bacterium]|nr:hypothetical protein [Catalimonadaceae bacterium]